MTTRDPRHDILFEPVHIGPKTMPNRFYAVPHSAGTGTEKPFSQAAFRGMKAEGGWGVVCTEYAPVSADSEVSPSVDARVWDDEDARALGLMCDKVHAHGALAGIELTHVGGYTIRNESRWPAISPSQFPSAIDPRVTPKAMEKSDIERVQRDWVNAARRVRDVGFDIVYVYGGNDLTTQFLSPFFNHRTDAYGGSLENRTRFWLETLEMVRAAVGDDCAITTRLNLGPTGSGAIDLDDILRFVELADPLVDLWDLTMEPIDSDVAPSRFFEQGHQTSTTGAIRAVTAKPIVGVGRLTDPDKMVEILDSGVWDIIGGARPSIADPFLPNKIREGRYDDIRECIGCNVCVYKAEAGRHIGCTQNPTAGEEHRRGWHPEKAPPARDRKRGILVVGAGPAGLECGLTLARRGFDHVHIVDADRKPGGHMRWMSRLPGLGEWARVVDYRTTQLATMRNVQLAAGKCLDAAAILNYGADVVILATGSTWAGDGITPFSREPIPGADTSLPHVLTPEQIMVEGKRPPAARVVVFDTDGYTVGPGIAELLVGEGFAVELATPFDQVAHVCDMTLESGALRRRMHEGGVVFRRRESLTAISPSGLRFVGEFGDETEASGASVVLVTRRCSDDALYHELVGDPSALAAENISLVLRAGDCVAPRLTSEAIFDGHRLAQELETDDPAVPLPYLRERQAVS